jgi:hypothetical protein
LKFDNADLTDSIDTPTGAARQFHGSRDISPLLLKQIIKDVRIMPEEFAKHL